MKASRGQDWFGSRTRAERPRTKKVGMRLKDVNAKNTPKIRGAAYSQG
jgi:hypothetical protein